MDQIVKWSAGIQNYSLVACYYSLWHLFSNLWDVEFQQEDPRVPPVGQHVSPYNYMPTKAPPLEFYGCLLQ